MVVFALFSSRRVGPVTSMVCVVNATKADSGGGGLSDMASLAATWCYRAPGKVMNFFGRGGGSVEGSGDTSQSARRNLIFGGGKGGNGLCLAMDSGFDEPMKDTGKGGKALGVGGGSVDNIVDGMLASIDAAKLSRRAMCSACYTFC